MKLNVAGLAVLACLPVVGAILFSDDRSDILPAMAGCFPAPSALPGSQIRIGASGELVTQAGRTSVSAQEDQLGLFLVPKERVVVQGGAVSLEAGNPLLMRIAPDRRSFFVPNPHGADAVFERASCA